MKNKLIVSFFSTIVFLLVCHVSFNDIKYDEYENRNLKQLPTLSIDKLYNGQLASEIDEYISDQFPFKRLFLNIKSSLVSLSLQTKNNDIYFGQDKFLLEEFKYTPYFDQNIKYLETYLNSHSEAHLITIPTSSQSLSNKLPAYAINEYQPLGYDITLDNDDYFKTDHHINHRGAQKLVCEYMNTIKQPCVNHQETIVNDAFQGSYQSKANGFFNTFDQIYQINNDLIAYNHETKLTASFYDHEALNHYNKYLFYTGSTPSYMTVTSPYASTNKKLVLFKDSNSHILVPYLGKYFAQIDLVDLRYVAHELENILNENSYDNYLFVYSHQTLNLESGLKKLALFSD